MKSRQPVMLRDKPVAEMEEELRKYRTAIRSLWNCQAEKCYLCERCVQAVLTLIEEQNAGLIG